MRKTVAAIFAAALLTVCSVAPAFASAPAGYADTDMSYEGELDMKTGAPASDNAYSSSSNRTRVQISSGIVYDTEKKVYCYQVSDTEVEMNVPSGCVTNSPVSITVPDGVEAKLFLNGEELADAELSSVKVPGKYVLRFSSSEDTYLNFTVVGSVTGIISGYQIPAGFRITSVYLDGTQLAASSYVDMSQEGEYAIKYKCDKTGVEYTLDVTIDNEPPTLLLEAVENGAAKGPVDISDLERGASINILLNGERIQYEEVLTRSGKYDIILQDEAGNVNSYSFVIRVYFNLSATLFFIAILLLAAGLLAYLFISRKNLRVR